MTVNKTKSKSPNSTGINKDKEQGKVDHLQSTCGNPCSFNSDEQLIKETEEVIKNLKDKFYLDDEEQPQPQNWWKSTRLILEKGYPFDKLTGEECLKIFDMCERKHQKEMSELKEQQIKYERTRKK